MAIAATPTARRGVLSDRISALGTNRMKSRPAKRRPEDSAAAFGGRELKRGDFPHAVAAAAAII